MILALAESRASVSDLCRKFHVRRLDLFGSAARATDFSPESDIDLLVEYEEPHAPPALSDFFEFREELARLFGRKVDLTMAGAVRNPYVLAEIERSREPLHGA